MTYFVERRTCKKNLLFNRRLGPQAPAFGTKKKGTSKMEAGNDGRRAFVVKCNDSAARELERQ